MTLLPALAAVAILLQISSGYSRLYDCCKSLGSVVCALSQRRLGEPLQACNSGAIQQKPQIAASLEQASNGLQVQLCADQEDSPALCAARGVQAGTGEGEGHADLVLMGSELPTESLHKFPHLAGCTAIRVPAGIREQVRWKVLT